MVDAGWVCQWAEDYVEEVAGVKEKKKLCKHCRFWTPSRTQNPVWGRCNHRIVRTWVGEITPPPGFGCVWWKARNPERENDNGQKNNEGAVQMIEWYEHHGNTVAVRSDLKGRHRENCLCHTCDKFKPEDREANCPIASEVYALDCERGLVTPVWECPEHVPGRPE